MYATFAAIIFAAAACTIEVNYAVVDPASSGCLAAVGAGTECPASTLCIVDVLQSNPCGTDATKNPPIIPCTGSGNRAGRCRSPNIQRVPSRDGLIKGFDVAPFPLEQVFERDQVVEAYHYTAPPGTRVVQCAVFVCTPSFGKTSRTISNYETCAIRQRMSERQEDTFDLRTPLGKASEALSCRGRGAIELLAVGCWAYDDSQLIGATELLPVDATNGYNDTAAIFDIQCTSGRPNSCALGVGTFGLCDRNRCASRCMTNSDCVARVATGDAGICPAEGSPSCVAVEGSVLGVCRPPPPRLDAGAGPDSGDGDGGDGGDGGAGGDGGSDGG